MALKKTVHQKGGHHGSAHQRKEHRKKWKEGRITHFHAQLSFFAFVTTVRLETCDIEASASPRKP